MYQFKNRPISSLKHVIYILAANINNLVNPDHFFFEPLIIIMTIVVFNLFYLPIKSLILGMKCGRETQPQVVEKLNV